MSEGMFPTLGMRFDITSLAQWDAAMDAAEKKALDVGAATQTAAAQVEAANRKMATSAIANAAAQKAAADGSVDALESYVAKLQSVVNAANGLKGGSQALQVDRALLNSRLALSRQASDQQLSYDRANLQRRFQFWADAAKASEQAAAREMGAVRAAAEADNRSYDLRQAALQRYERAEAEALNARYDLQQAFAAKLTRADADAENRSYDSLAAALGRRERATADSQNRLYDAQVANAARLLRQEAETEAAFVEKLQLRAAANVPTSANQVSLYRAQATAQNYGPGATAAIAQIEAVNQALADASKAAQGAEFLQELEALQKFGVKLGPTTIALKSMKAEQLGVAAAAAPMIAGLEKTGAELAKVGGMSTRVREGFVLLREAGRGDFTRMAGSLSIEAQALGLMGVLLNPVVAGVLALIAAFVGLAVVIDKGAQQLADFNNQMKATDGYAGITFGHMTEESERLAKAADTTIGAVMKTMQAVVASGKVAGAAVDDTTEAAVRLAGLTKQSGEKVAQSLTGMYGDAANAAAKLNEQVHFLTLAQYEEIDALQKSGDSAGAYALAVHDLAEHLKTEGTPEMGYFEQAIHSVHQEIDKGIEKLKEWGRAATNAQKVVQDTRRIDSLQQTANARPWDPAVRQDLDAALAKFQKDQDAAAADETAATLKSRQAQVQANGIAGYRAALATDRSIGQRSANEAYIKELQDQYRTSVTNGLKANPNDPLLQEDQRNMDARLQAIRERHSPHVRRGGSTLGTQNRLNAQSGRIEGLLADITNPDQSLVAQMNDQIRTAGLQAAGGFSVGARSQFQTRAASQAEQLKSLELFKQINDQLAKQTLAEREKAAADKLMADAQDQATQAQQAYYASGQTSLAGDLHLQQQLIDVEEKARESQNALDVARQAGGTSMASLHDELMGVKGATEATVAATVQHAQALLTEKNAVDQATAAEAKKKLVQDALTEAMKAYDAQQRGLRLLQNAAAMTPAEREAQAYIETAARVIQIQAYQQTGVVLTDAQAQNIAKANALLDQQAEKWATLTIDIQNAIRDGFIDTGKISFKDMRKKLTQELRAAVYDALLAKPIDIVVNATVSLLNQIEGQMLAPVANAINGALGLGGSDGGFNLGGSSEPLGTLSQGTKDFLDSFGGGPNSFGGKLEDNAFSLDSLSHSVSALNRGLFGGGSGGASLGSLFGLGGSGAAGSAAAANSGLGGLGGMGGTLGAALAVGQVSSMFATALSHAFGLNSQQTKLAGQAGFLVGGPLGTLIGKLFGGKPTNGAAFGEFTRTSAAFTSDNKTSQQSAQLAQAFGQTVLSLEQGLASSGIATKNYVSGVDIGTRDVPNVTFSNGVTARLGKVGDAAAAAAAAMVELLKDATYQSDAQKQLVDSIINSAKSLDELAQKLQDFTAAQSFLKGIDSSLLKAQDPLGGALADLRDQQIARRQQAIGYYQEGVISADQLTALQGKLKTLETLEIDQTISQFNTGLQDVTATLSDFQSAQQRIIDYTQGLLTSADSALSPQDQLAAAARAYQQTLAKAQGGDKTSLDNISGAADTYLKQAHGFYGSTGGYAQVFDAVYSQLQALGTQAYPGPTPAGVDASGDTEAGALAALQTAISQNNADLITALSPVANDSATGADIAGQTQTLVGALQGVQQTIAASTEAIVASNSNTAASGSLSLQQLMGGGAV